MSKRLVFVVKLLVMTIVMALVGWKIVSAWNAVKVSQLPIHWQAAPVGLAGFAGLLLASALVWRLIAAWMGDRSPTVPLLGAYVFSQLGKYVPGKVMLLLMRVERTRRFGMDAQTCTLSTLLENALYMISGGLAGLGAVFARSGSIPAVQRSWLLAATSIAVLFLLGLCHPRVFYGLVNQGLKKMKRPAVPAEQRLSFPQILTAVLLFLPGWGFGGLVLWASLACVHPVPFASIPVLSGAFALSVIIGMASLLPGGLGVKESIVAVFMSMELSSSMDHDHAMVYAAVAMVLQRLFQLAAEAILGLAGAALTARAPAVAAAPGAAA